jgi:hypothetical protein
MKINDFGKTAIISFFLLVAVLSLTGCADTPKHPYIAGPIALPECNNVPANAKKDEITPEIAGNPPYTMHYLEFDDQGWPYSDTNQADNKWSPGHQIDCAIKDLVEKLKKGPVRSFVYVHGWHHSADAKDRDVRRFRELLAKQAHETNRHVVGFYIGWEGDTLKFPILENFSFWGRKNAAHHIAEGSVREFFSRIKSLRNHYNDPDKNRSINCGEPTGWIEQNGCPLRVVMIGHSFGAWILYSATSPYILETLAGIADLPKEDNAKLPVTARERGIADLILLLNPAFEATRYEPVHRAARRYRPKNYESPLLVSVTSTADDATKTLFPIARFFNSIFQYPATSDEESIAMKRTHGHIDHYVTHELTLSTTSLPQQQEQPLCDRQSLRRDFFKLPATHISLAPNWVRKMCGGLTLKSMANPELHPYSIVWNVRTFSEIIPDHNTITGQSLEEFFIELYGDLERTPRLEIDY